MTNCMRVKNESDISLFQLNHDFHLAHKKKALPVCVLLYYYYRAV